MIPRLLPHIPVILSIIGLILISAGVLVWSLPLGLIASGACVLILEWRITE